MTATPLSGAHRNGAVVMRIDITERKRAEGILRESERRFSGLLGNIQMASVMLDRDARITYCNEYLLHLTGWRLEEVLGRDWFETFMPVEFGDMRPVFAQLLDDLPEAWYREHEIRTRSGERRLLRWNNSVLRSGDGAVVGTASIGADITEHRRNREALLQNEERTRSIVDSALDAVVVMDAAGRITDWNPQAERTFGWPRQQAIGRKLAETIIPVAYREDHARGLRRFLETGVGPVLRKPIEISAIHRDGRRIPVELTITPVKLAGEWVFNSFIRDLSERKRGEHELQRFASAIDATSDAICMVDRATMSFVHVNDAACRMHRRTRAELMAMAPGSVLLSVSADELARTYDEIIASGVPAEPLEIPSRGDDGVPRWLELRRHAQRSGGHWVIVSVVRDITERKAAESRIRRLNRLYAVLIGINSLIVRAADREELFREACRICVEVGAFKTAWIGTVDPVTLNGEIAASHGDEAGCADPAWLTACDEGPAGDLPACRALRESRPVICNDISTDPALATVRERLLGLGYQSMACFPLKISGRSEAVLALFAAEAEVFDDEEARLLEELAGDITHALDHIEKKELLDYLAYYDALTGLANRKLFFERVGQDLRSSASGDHELAVVLIDLERFRNVNDSLGRAAGDALLRQVAEWLAAKWARRQPPGRVGADQFALVMLDVKQADDVARILEQTLEAFQRHTFRLGDAELRIAAKVGVALFPEDGDNAEVLLSRAEAALTKAKASGEGYLFYTQKMTELVAGKLTLESQLRQALERDEFVLHYQPKVKRRERQADWRRGAHPVERSAHRPGSPGQFIPILEETGLMHAVGRWALRRAIEDHLRWRTAGLDPVRIAVNVSPMQLRHRDFVAEIREAIGIDPRAARAWSWRSPKASSWRT
jgi:diguanylate cyclase (GGDEF)-like protein/PAS domain S-box-containing protein